MALFRQPLMDITYIYCHNSGCLGCDNIEAWYIFCYSNPTRVFQPRGACPGCNLGTWKRRRYICRVLGWAGCEAFDTVK